MRGHHIERTTVALVGCCKDKASTVAPARELYRSPLFRMSLEYAEHVLYAQHVFILSAKHGAIRPDDLVDPYDLALTDFDEEELAWWRHTVSIQLADALGFNWTSVHEPRFRWVLLASDLYKPDPPVWGPDRPLDGMQIGERLSWLKQQIGARRAA